MPTVQLTGITIGIVVFNTAPDLLKNCIESATESRAGVDHPVEIVVFDNSSNKELHSSFASIVDSWSDVGQNLGFGAACNELARQASGSHILFLNPDARLEPHALQALCVAVNESKKDALYCGWLLKDGRVQTDAFLHWWTSTGRLIRRDRYRRYLEGRADSDAAVPVLKASGGALWASKQLLLELGPFDARFFLYGEDADLSVRARNLGIGVYAVPQARIHHAAASSQDRFSKLVEMSRTDAAIRIASHHLQVVPSLVVRLDLLLITLAGLLSPRSSSANRRARVSRLHELRRWGVHRDRKPFRPSS